MLSAAADGELDPDEAAALDVHLARCPTCTTRLRSFESYRRRLRFQAPRAPFGLRAEIAAARERQIAVDRRRSVVSHVALVAAVLVVAVVWGSTLITSDRSTVRRGPGRTTAEIALTRRVPLAPTLEVAAGTKVRWRNDSGSTHQLVRVVGGATVADELLPGRSTSVTYDRAGIYRYYCTVHPQVAGTVRVEG